MDKYPEITGLIIPTTLLQLRISLKYLDCVGASVAAAHVASAIDCLQADFKIDDFTTKIEQSYLLDYSIMDGFLGESI